jgi:tripartite-type tricarboxylate transporter receptor subunit TctC
MTRFGVGNFRGLMDAGKVRMLAIATNQRSKQFPDVPTLKEAGLNYPGQGWWGLAAPKGTPQAVVDKANAAFVSVFSDPTFTAFLDKQLVVPAPTSPAAFAAFLKEDRKAAEALVKIANAPRKEYKPQ